MSSPGCMDETAFNYNPNATTDNGSCSGPIYGCIDNGNMTNGMGEINDLDGDGLPAFNYDPLANINDSSCVPIIEACLDNNACNYNVAGNTSDTSCVFLPDTNLCSYYSGEIDGSGTIVNNDDDGDGICNNDEVLGCTNPTALNYNPNATDNNGSCVFAQFQGCIDSFACNFDSNATQTNNNCVYADNECEICSGEIDGTGIVIDNDQDNDGVCDANEISNYLDVYYRICQSLTLKVPERCLTVSFEDIVKAPEYLVGQVSELIGRALNVKYSEQDNASLEYESLFRTQYTW